MSNVRKNKALDISLKVNGSRRHIRGVTKHTTCTDVIKMVLKKSASFGHSNSNTDSYAIFESSRGIERILSGKTRLVKVIRSWGADSNFEFVFRKINPVVSMPKISEAKRRKINQRLRNNTDNEENKITPNEPRYGYVSTRIGMSHFQNVALPRNESDCSNEFVKELYFNESEDSIDEHVTSVSNINNMNVQSVKLMANRRCRSRSPYFVDSCNAGVANVNNVKYAVRKTLKSKTLSTSNICSVSSDENNLKCRPVKHKFIDSTPRKEPMHSTPSNGVSKADKRFARRHDQLASDIVSKVTRLHQREGKDALLQKYFADYITYNSPKHRTRSAQRTRGDGAEDDHISPLNRQGDGAEQTDDTSRRVSKNTNDQTTHLDEDTDSGQEEEEVSTFDNAFIDVEANIPEIKPACVGKLVDYSISEDEFSYTSDPSMISNASDISSVSDLVKNAFSDSADEDEDDLMESFMNTKNEDFFSDEGLSSMGSDDEKEIIV